MSKGRIERRLSTILAADIVGYSRMVGEDEEGTVSAVKAQIDGLARPKAAQYNGRIVKLMGDGLLLEFGSIADAVLFAVELHLHAAEQNTPLPENRQIRYRVGINIGEIIVDGDDIHGAGVNIAARLESLAEPDSIFLSEAAYQQIAGKLDLTFLDKGSHQVKNIAEPVSVFQVPIDEKAKSFQTAVEELPPETQGGRGLWPLVAAAALVVILFAGGLAWWQLGSSGTTPAKITEQSLPLPKEPSLAVLPFKTIGSAEDHYLANGLTSDLSTDLSRFDSLFVSAGSSVAALREQTQSLKEIAAKLGVRYLLEGDIQQAGEQIRVNVKFLEAASEKTLWAQRFDRKLDDVFALQDEIVQEIIKALTLKVSEEELKRAQQIRPSDMAAYDYVLRGRNLDSENSRDANLQSRELFQTAIELDPAYAPAYGHLARTFVSAAANGWAQNPRQSLKRAHDLAQAAIDIESHPHAHAVLGMTYYLMHHFDLAEAELKHAIAMNPNDADSYATLGTTHLWTSRLDSALEALQKAYRLNPRAPASLFADLGMVYYLKEDYANALAALEEAAAQAPDHLLAQMFLAACNAELGRNEAATAAAEKVKKLHPFFSVEPYRRAFANAEHGEKLATALSKLGL